MDALDPVAVLVRTGGVCSGTGLRKVCDPWTIRKAVRGGRILRATRNRYVLPEAEEAVAAAAGLHGVVSHLSAAMAWGWKVRRPPERPDVSVDPKRRIAAARRTGVAVHWQAVPPSHRTVGGRTSRIRTVLDCARTLPFADALSVADSALREGKVSKEELRAGLDAVPRHGRRQARRVISEADPRAANPFESSLRAIALDVVGLSVEPQWLVEWVGRVDLADPHLRIVIEADSYAWHGGAGVFRYDIRRHAALVRAGWTVVRFCWEDVMHRPDYVRAVLADLVARGPDCRPVHVSAADRRL